MTLAAPAFGDAATTGWIRCCAFADRQYNESCGNSTLQTADFVHGSLVLAFTPVAAILALIAMSESEFLSTTGCLLHLLELKFQVTWQLQRFVSPQDTIAMSSSVALFESSTVPLSVLPALPSIASGKGLAAPKASHRARFTLVLWSQP